MLTKRQIRKRQYRIRRNNGWTLSWVRVNPRYKLLGQGGRYPNRIAAECMIRDTSKKYPDRVPIVEKIINLHDIGYLYHEERELLKCLVDHVLKVSEEFDEHQLSQMDAG